MTASTVIDSLLFRDAFGTAAMREIFSDTALVARYVDPDTDDGLDALRRLHDEAPGALPRRIVIEPDEPALVVGHHSFRPAEIPEVLTPAQAAALLQVEEEDVLALAEEGRLPGRRIGDEWRFGRAALVAWLSEPD